MARHGERRGVVGERGGDRRLGAEAVEGEVEHRAAHLLAEPGALEASSEP
jgi:hypothetical protein